MMIETRRKNNLACSTLLLATLLIGQAHAALYIVTRSDDRNVSTANCPSTTGTPDCSLREALTISNSTPGPNTINIQANNIALQISQPLFIGRNTSVINGQSGGITTTLQAATGGVSIPMILTTADRTGELTINNLVMGGASNLIGAGGALIVERGNVVNLNNVLIRDSRAGLEGGAIYIRGAATGNPPTRVRLSGSVISNNRAASGGGINVEQNAELTLDNSIVRENSVGRGCGGGVQVFGTLSIVNGGEISGNSADLDGGKGGGICNASTGTVTIQNTRIADNTARSEGGGVYNDGTITFTGATVDGNRANSAGGGFYNANALTINSGLIQRNSCGTGGSCAGGGIQSTDTLSVTGTVISNNAAVDGGGVNNLGRAVLVGVTLDGNSAAGAGGGIRTSGELRLSNSTVSRNTAFASAGIEVSITNSASGAVISNTTISGNFVSDALGDAGGIRALRGDLNLINATVSNNTGVFSGLLVAGGTVSARNTIISNNTLTPNFSQAVVASGRFQSLGNNLFGSASGFIPDSSDRIGTDAAPIDARLRPLGNYSGSTQTQPPFADSPAVDAGNNCVVVAGLCGDGNPALSTDQRGLTRIGSITNFVSDIGAVELQTAVVTNITDATPTPPFNSLRSFVEGAFPYDVITFSASAFTNPNTSINLIAPLTVNRTMEIFGFNPNSPKITGGTVRPFVVTTSGDLRLSNVSVLIGLVGNLNGGLINNAGRLSLFNCTMSLSQTTGNGGGLFNDVGASAEIDRCTFTNNFAGVGGAIFNLGSLRVSRSSFALNVAAVGAAISSADAGPNSSVLTSVTIANNRATTGSGGLRYLRTAPKSSFVLQNSIVADNTSPVADGKPDLNGDFTSLGNNLIGRSDGGTGFADGDNGDIVGSIAAPVTANLNVSSNTVNNGGQAFTLRPLPASRAINNGVALGFATDQRGFPRTVGGAADIGAIEFNMTPIATLEGVRRRLPNSSAGATYAQTIEALGAPSGSVFAFAAATLPTFLTLTPSITSPSTATLSGTPTLAQAGTYTFSITATAPAPDAFSVSNDYILTVQSASILNIDNSAPDTIYDAATDGVLLLRYLFGVRGAALIANARGVGPALRDAGQVETFIASNLSSFDVDGDGQVLPMTDGLMIVRRLLNPKAANLLSAAEISAMTANTKQGALTDSQVLQRIEALKP
jgi:Putative Ig domain